MKITFEFEKETKNTMCFKEMSDTPVVGTLYVKKSALSALDYKQGDRIVATISKEEKL